MKVDVVCRNFNDDRVIPRFARYLAMLDGWNVTRQPSLNVDGYYLSGYFEHNYLKYWNAGKPIGAYLTHKEEVPVGNPKAKLFDDIAERVDIRFTSALRYTQQVGLYGQTVQFSPPVERDFFTIPARKNSKLTAGFSGYTYGNGRKGEHLAPALVKLAPKINWLASGRGWCVPTTKFPWSQMAGFYQSLDVLVITAQVEGIPMPPLEALSCGVSIVIPEGVGLHDELPDVHGIHRYKKGDQVTLNKAFLEALDQRSQIDREALRGVTEHMTISNFQQAHVNAFEEWFDKNQPQKKKKVYAMKHPSDHKKDDTKKRGIVVVAFGDPSRKCAEEMMTTAKEHVPEIPICLVASEPIGLEDIFVEQPDTDIGGRIAKIKVYELTPSEWDSVLYMDADTEVVNEDIRFYFELIEQGWDFVICKDPHNRDTMHSFVRANNHEELKVTEEELGSLNVLQFNGGVWSFSRREGVKEFFDCWLEEWERWGMRDQAALVRALYQQPLRMFVLGNEWNWFENYSKGTEACAIKHYPSKARRWTGQINGRLDSKVAWDRVNK